MLIQPDAFPDRLPTRPIGFDLIAADERFPDCAR